MAVVAKQRDLFTRRFRSVAPPDPSEAQIQISLVTRLRLLARKDCVYFHPPNGGVRDQRAAAKLKAMGVLPGVPDLIFQWPIRCMLYLELKRRGGGLDETQRLFRDRMQKIGFDYEVATSLDEAIAILTTYKILPPEGKFS